MKKLSQWLDEFVSNGADPTDVPEWPNQGGGSSESVGIIVTPEGHYNLKVNFKELKNFVIKNNIDLDAELNIKSGNIEATGFNIGTILYGEEETSQISNATTLDIKLEMNSGQFTFVTMEGGSTVFLGEPKEHNTLLSVIDMAIEHYGDWLADLQSIYFDEEDSFIQTIGFHQGSDNTLQVYPISKEDWEKIFILTPANQGE